MNLDAEKGGVDLIVECRFGHAAGDLFPGETDAYRQDLGISEQSFSPPGIDDLCSLQKPLAGRTVFQMDQAAPSHQAFFRYFRKRCQEPIMGRNLGLCAHRHHIRAAQSRCLAAYTFTDLVSNHFRENRINTNNSGLDVRLKSDHVR